MIYLDYSANTPVDPAVLARFCETERAYIGNANSRHSAGRDAATEQERVSASAASQLGVSPEELIFTSGASEANNLAIKGIARASRHIGKGVVFQRKLDEYDICVSVKAACSVPELPSRAVFAVSRDRKNALASWRVSLSHLTTEKELEAFLERFDRADRGRVLSSRPADRAGAALPGGR